MKVRYRAHLIAALTAIAGTTVGGDASSAAAPAGPWDAFNLAPAGRSVPPVTVFKSGGTVGNATGVLAGQTTTLSGAGSYVTLDFGKEVGGFVKLRFGSGSSPDQRVGLTFSESSEAIDPARSDASNGFSNDEPPLEYAVTPGAAIDTRRDVPTAGRVVPTSLTAAVSAGATSLPVVNPVGLTGSAITVDSGAARETVRVTSIQFGSPNRANITPALTAPHPAGAPVALGPESTLRGGFRYLTLVNRTAGTLELATASVDVTFAPQASDLRAYENYFYSDDALLNRIWYAGAYTVQTNIIANDQGRVWFPPSQGWNNSALVGESGSSVLVDGAKRDRTIWPGDLGFQVPTDFASLGDMATVKNTLQTLYNHQNAAGALPYAGPVVNSIGTSDAYHMWSLIGTANYFQYSADKAWLDSVWSKYKLGITYITAKLGSDGLLNVTSANDWARTNAGGKQIEAQAIMYHTLTTCRTLAVVEGDTALAASCASQAAALKSAVSGGGYWDPSQGLYRNVPTGTSSDLYPQDGNALAIWFGLVDTTEKTQAISCALAARWTSVGALTPEKSASSVHPFPGGMELNAHLLAGQDTRALELVRREWGFMLNAPQGTASTFWEGYKTDGSSDYNGSYQSLAHGWATAPTASLTFYVLGLRPDSEGGATYSLVPHPGDLKHVEGQLTTPKGVIKQSYDADAGSGTFSARYSAPAGALDTVAVPTFGKPVRVFLDGKLTVPASTDGQYAYTPALTGEHTIASCPVASCALGDVGGTVPATLSLTLGNPAAFAAFTPGVDRSYDASTTANVTSTAGDATLSVTDPSATATGRLVNASFSLSEPLQAKANSGAFTPLSTTAGSPLTLLSYSGPVSNDAVAIGVRQHIAANQALRTGAYGKTLTFTLSTTTP